MEPPLRVELALFQNFNSWLSGAALLRSIRSSAHNGCPKAMRETVHIQARPPRTGAA